MTDHKGIFEKIEHENKAVVNKFLIYHILLSQQGMPMVAKDWLW